MSNSKTVSDFGCFFQINRNYKIKFIKLLGEPQASRVFWYLVIRSDKFNCYKGGIAVIASELKMDKKMVIKALKYLNDNDYIRTETYTHNVIFQWINPALIWRTKPELKKACAFYDAKENRAIFSFNNFVQINYSKITRELYVDCLIENYKAFNLFMYLVIRMEYSREVEVTKKSLSEILSVSETSVYRYARYLQDKGFLRLYDVQGVCGFEISHTLASRENEKEVSALFDTKLNEGGNDDD